MAERFFAGGVLQQVRLFFTAVQFFTRLPIPRWVGFEESWLQAAIRFFPSIGWMVAALTGAVYWLASMRLPPTIAVLLSTVAGILLTGALHEDGFADVCDGFGGGVNAERVFEIMKDSRVGAYGAIGIGLMLALKCTALASLPTLLVLPTLWIAHTLSRFFASSLIWRLDYAKAEGKAKPMAKQMSNAEFAFAMLTTIVPIAILIATNLISWQKVAVGTISAALACAYLVSLFLRRIGGYTGDCLGAVQQATEVAFYLGVLAC